MGDRKFPISHDDIPVHGFILDGNFVAHDSTVRCLSDRERKQLSDAPNGKLACHTGFSIKGFVTKAEAKGAANAELVQSMSKGKVEEVS